MLSSLVSLALSQAGNKIRILVDPGKDSGALRAFTIEVPKAWTKNGVWPLAKGNNDDGLTHWCGGKNTLTLSLAYYPGETLKTVLAAFALTRKRHPDRFWEVKSGAVQGAMIEVPVGKSGSFLSGRLFLGNHLVLYYQYPVAGHGTPQERDALLDIVESVRPK